MPVIAPIYLRWLLFFTSILLIAGFVTPMLTISKLVFLITHFQSYLASPSCGETVNIFYLS